MLKSDRNASRRGSALVASILLLAVLGTGTTVALRSLHGVSERHQDRMRWDTLQYVAEGGIALAVWELRRDPLWSPAKDAQSLGAGKFRIDVQRRGAGEYIIRSEAELDVEGPCLYRVIIDAEMTMEGGAITAYRQQVERKRL